MEKRDLGHDIGLCGECRYFSPWSGYRSEQSDPDTVRGDCRRYPPQVVPANQAAMVDSDNTSGVGGSGDFRLINRWPIVEEIVWCGEYAPPNKVNRR